MVWNAPSPVTGPPLAGDDGVTDRVLYEALDTLLQARRDTGPLPKDRARPESLGRASEPPQLPRDPLPRRRLLLDANASRPFFPKLDSLQRMLAARPELSAARIGDDRGSKMLLHVVTDWPGFFPNGPAVVNMLITAGSQPNARTEGANHGERVDP